MSVLYPSLIIAQRHLYHISGLLDYEAASKIDPKNEQLQADAVRIRDIIQGTAPS